MDIPAPRLSNRASFSMFWNTPDLEDQEPCMIRRLGLGCPGEFRGKVIGYHDCDADGHPWAYIVELIDRIPGQKLTASVFPRGCVDSLRDVDVSQRFVSNHCRMEMIDDGSP